MYIDLKNSNSSCDLKIKYKDESLIVTKTIENNNRNLKSIRKQVEFNNSFGLKSVPLINEKKDYDKIVITMPFVKGLVGSDIAENFSKEEEGIFRNIIKFYFEQKIKNSENLKLDKNIIIKKIKDVEKKIIIKLSPNQSLILEKTISNIMIKLDYIDKYEKSECHGDFTLSNMIFKENNIYLIDFIDVYINSYIVDLVKLEQDTLYGWSCRFENESLQHKNKILFMELNKSLDKYRKINKNFYNVCSLMNTLRILPYVKDKITEDWVFKTLKIQNESIEND